MRSHWLVFLVGAALGAGAPAIAANRRPATWTAPGVSVQRLLAEDEANRQNPLIPLRVAHPMKAGLTPADSGIWAERPNGDRVWRLTVRSPGALWLGLSFGTYRLQPGGVLRVHDPARRTELGPYTAADVQDHGTLWLPPIPGDRAILELEWPRRLAGVEPNLELGQVSHGYRPLGSIGEEPPGEGGAEPRPLGVGTSGFCNIDINCPLGADWQEQKLSVVQLLFNDGLSACTGTLLNNTALDCRPLILTARHCLFPPGGAPVPPESTVVRFNYERQSCDFGTALTIQNVVGATVLADWAGSDFVLLELTQPIPSNFAHRFSGWNRGGAPPTESWSIHHPSADPRKISFNNDPVVTSPLSNSHWRVQEWELGTTEAGSSGAPLFDQHQRVVGQLGSGLAQCDVFLPDDFGRFDFSWSGQLGGGAAKRLRDWLDPANAGDVPAGQSPVTLDGLDPSYCEIPRPNLVKRRQFWSGDLDGIVAPGETVRIAVELSNSGTQPAENVSGTLTTTDARVTVLDNQASWPALSPLETAIADTPYFTVRLSPTLPCGDPVHLTLTVNASGDTWTAPVDLTTGTVVETELFADDIEAGTAAWTQQSAGANPNSWTVSTTLSLSPAHSWFVPDLGVKSDTRLQLQALGPLPPRSVLRFAHYINSERGFDGGVLEYCIAANCAIGTAWVDAGSLITRGGYNSALSTNTLPGNRPAWSGDLGSFQEVEVDLRTLATRTIAFRWRFATDLTNADDGWYIDNVRLERIDHTCAPPARARTQRHPPSSPGPRTR